MKKFKVIITFADGSELLENSTSSSEEMVFEELSSRMKNSWFYASKGAKYTYRNPSTVVNIEIIDIEEDTRLTKERTEGHLKSIKQWNS